MGKLGYIFRRISSSSPLHALSPSPSHSIVGRILYMCLCTPVFTDFSLRHSNQVPRTSPPQTRHSSRYVAFGPLASVRIPPSPRRQHLHFLLSFHDVPSRHSLDDGITYITSHFVPTPLLLLGPRLVVSLFSNYSPLRLAVRNSPICLPCIHPGHGALPPHLRLGHTIHLGFTPHLSLIHI